MSRDDPAEDIHPEHAITYLLTASDEGDLETGTVLLDGRPIGRLRSRPRTTVVARQPFESLVGGDSVWHAEAVGWLPHEGRPWDMRITSSAPTRRRAAEDLLRAYGNRYGAPKAAAAPPASADSHPVRHDGRGS
jgi:hypothetical protein